MAFIKTSPVAKGEPKTPSEIKKAINDQVRVALKEAGLPEQVTLFQAVKASEDNVLMLHLESMSSAVKEQLLTLLDTNKVKHSIQDDIEYQPAVNYEGQLSVRIDPNTKRLENRVIFYANRQKGTHPLLNAITISGTLEAKGIGFKADDQTAKTYYDAKEQAARERK